MCIIFIFKTWVIRFLHRFRSIISDLSIAVIIVPSRTVLYSDYTIYQYFCFCGTTQLVILA